MDEGTNEAASVAWTRVVVGCVAGALAGPALVVALVAFGLPVSLAVPIAVMLIVACAWHPALLGRFVPLVPRSRGWLAAWLIVSAVAGVQNARLAVFMIDPGRADASVFPDREFFRQHSCATAYTEAARLAATGANVYDPALYHSTRMAEDVRALLDHLALGPVDVMGYSMGARIAAFFALAHPARVRSAVLGGLGIRLVDGVGLSESIADALEARSLADVDDPTARTFRRFAEQTGSDLAALAACMRGSRQFLTRSQVGTIRAPVLVAVGSSDTVAGSAQELAALLPAGRALDIPGRDHMLAVGDRAFKEAVRGFLAGRP